MKVISIEYCVVCNQYIESSDSIYCEYCGEGPFCNDCYADHCALVRHGRKPSENID